MEALFSRLMTQVYELEGLLLVVDKHGDETPQVVYKRIGELGQEIAQRAGQLASQPQAEPMVNVMPAPAVEPEPVAEPVAEHIADSEPVEAAEPKMEGLNQPEPRSEAKVYGPPIPTRDLPEQDYDADETWQHDNGEEFTEVFKADYVEPEPVIKPQPRVVLVEPQPDPQPLAEPEEAQSGEDLRVDEKLQRSLSKDMHKALSLNDRFRFQRELFAGSKNDLNNALDLVNAMLTYDEAEEYFIHDLGWDQDNEDVADFMGLVRRHFL